MDPDAAGILGAEVVLPCSDLGANLGFFTGQLGFQVGSILPADDPQVAVIHGHGLRLRLQRGADPAPMTLRLQCQQPRALGGDLLQAPNGTRVELHGPTELVVPPLLPTFSVTRMTGGRAWHEGRAGMRYRDLIPGRLGGHCVASHIHVPRGGLVPDYVHHHRLALQLIYCRSGWVRVVYEDQGPPFVLAAGDCVLQPPGIRHRVLECAEGMEVVELACPAEHETLADPALVLPTGSHWPDRDYRGQRFVWHRADRAVWQPWLLSSFEARDLGIGAGSRGLADAWVARPAAAAKSSAAAVADSRCLFLFLLHGGVALATSTHGDHLLTAGDAAVIPPGEAFALRNAAPEAELLVVAFSPSAGS